MNGDLLEREERNRREVLLGDVGPLYVSDEKEVDDDSLSRNTISVTTTGEGDQSSAMDV